MSIGKIVKGLGSALDYLGVGWRDWFKKKDRKG